MSMALERSGVRPCPTCRRPELAGYPHRHDRPPRGDYDPMGPRPERLYCGELDVDAYWTEADWRPGCCLVHVVGAEYRAELPDAIHPVRYRPPMRTEPIPLHPGEPDGPTLAVLDAGAGWPWSPAAHRRFGGRGQRDGRDTLDRRDYAGFPWAYAIERRLDGYCRKRHATRPDLWPEHAGGPLCQRVVERIVADGVPPELVAIEMGIAPIRLRPLLTDALHVTWRFVSEQVNGLDVRRPRPVVSEIAPSV
jgi:hypothetical protein